MISTNATVYPNLWFLFPISSTNPWPAPRPMTRYGDFTLSLRGNVGEPAAPPWLPLFATVPALSPEPSRPRRSLSDDGLSSRGLSRR